MEQRRLRLGDILDDYCPRERRVTNHAVVAMIEEDVKQTRCTTCDAEHAYKGARVPARRKKETPAALYKEVLAGIEAAEEAPLLAAAAAPAQAPLSVAPPAVHVPDPVVTNSVHDTQPLIEGVQANADGPPSAHEDISSEAGFAGDEEAPVVDGP